jgi:putative membrane protein
VILAIIAVGLFNMAENLADALDAAGRLGWHWLALGLAAVLAVAFAWAFCWWRRARFRLAEGVLELVTGVVFRQRRTVRLDRVEAVDTVRPLVPRLMGLVKLRVESAGGSDSAVELAYLKVSDAARWRREILQAAASARQAAEAPGPGETEAAVTGAGMAGDAAGDAIWDGAGDGAGDGAAAGPAGGAAVRERADRTAAKAFEGAAGDQTASGIGLSSAGAPGPPKSVETQVGELLGDSDARAPELFAVPTARVLASMALSIWVWLAVAAGVAAVAMLIGGELDIAAGLLPVVFGAGGVIWGRLMSDFGFAAKQTSRGLTLSHGLTTRVSQTIANGRVLAVTLSQGPLWRRFGWWRAQMLVAGYGADSEQKQSVLVPVADRETVRRAIWAVAPALAQPGAWELVTSAMDSRGAAPGFTGEPARARLFDPFAWKREAFALTEEMLVLRGGWLMRTATVLHHGRIQGIELSQGPWDRRRDLASVCLHLPSGPVSAVIPHLGGADAWALVEGEAARLNAAMRAALAARDQPAHDQPAAHAAADAQESVEQRSPRAPDSACLPRFRW